MLFSSNEVLAIVVLYKTAIANSKTITTLTESLAASDNYLDILIYDNSPFKQDYSIPDNNRLRIHYVHDPSNGGVSKAYNYGASYAKEKTDKKWILLLDQDTSFSPDLISKFDEAYQNNTSLKLFVPILMTTDDIVFSPCKYYFRRGFPLKTVSAGVTFFKNISPVNSGMLIKLDAFFAAGMYNEAIKLDFSDFQFIERFKKVQHHFFVIDSVGYQDFSNHETDIQKLNLRYAFFCEGAKRFERNNVGDDGKLFLVALMRAVTLALRTRSTIYFSTFVNSYIKG